MMMITMMITTTMMMTVVMMRLVTPQNLGKARIYLFQRRTGFDGDLQSIQAQDFRFLRKVVKRRKSRLKHCFSGRSPRLLNRKLDKADDRRVGS
jgi:hypothetical protein